MAFYGFAERADKKNWPEAGFTGGAEVPCQSALVGQRTLQAAKQLSTNEFGWKVAESKTNAHETHQNPTP